MRIQIRFVSTLFVALSPLLLQAQDQKGNTDLLPGIKSKIELTPTQKVQLAHLQSEFRTRQATLRKQFVRRARTLLTPEQRAKLPGAVLFREGIDGYSGTVDIVITSHEPRKTVDDESLTNDVADNEPKHFQQALIRFEDIIGDQPDQIPKAVRVRKAILTVAVFDWGSGVDVHRILEPWSKSSTFASLSDGIDRFVKKPDSRTKLIHFRTNRSYPTTFRQFPSHSIEDPSRVAFDVTPSLKAWVEHGQPNHGWILLAPPSGRNGVGIHSSQAKNKLKRPLLVVEYEPLNK